MSYAIAFDKGTVGCLKLHVGRTVESLGEGGGHDRKNGAPIYQPFLTSGSVVNIQ